MNKFIITTDTTADLPADYVAEHNLGMLSLTYTIDGKTYDWEHPMDVKEFYAKMRAGSLPTTSQVNPETAREIFTKLPRKMTVIFFTLPFPADSAAATPVQKLLQVKWKKIISHIKSLS